MQTNVQAIETIASVLPALSRLNNWARCPYDQQLDMHEMPSRIYGWKRSVIAAAMRAGCCDLRIVAVERSCNPCKGTGTYRWVNWNGEYDVDYQTCRRCTGTGKVILRFVESNICGTKWHTPRPKWDLGVFAEDAWDKIAVAADWEPEQPGAPLGLLECIALINQVERVIYEGHKPEGRFGSATDYALNLGEVRGCWICGLEVSERWRTRKIYRGEFGLCWTVSTCERCNDAAAWAYLERSWPVNLHRVDERRERESSPPWESRVPIPLIAREPAVVEWLARRQIYIGRYPPTDFAYTCCGDFARILEATPHDYLVEIDDRHGWNGTLNGRPVVEWIGPLHEEKMRLKELCPTGRNPYLPTFDWSEVRV